MRSMSDPKSSVTTFSRIPMRARSCCSMEAIRSRALLPELVTSENSMAFPWRSRKVSPERRKPAVARSFSAAGGSQDDGWGALRMTRAEAGGVGEFGRVPAGNGTRELCGWPESVSGGGAVVRELVDWALGGRERLFDQVPIVSARSLEKSEPGR